ncbi:phosphatidylinositol mannoside acyltransferase [Nakamurella sp. PAMC28650]|uniref:phosphatidylinositol mannoside acyltransferase n=1 Tax=Nakamurella sp. PAMC28650 TaxID=2762325 RepID=UPI00164CF388|nr:phosphatidylinositol mannoside acyltransferase [Nakamurella sp. PAMC28650]QNK79535.1 phosphatidylinositol mannoside acyltransferase [Nakamurella sp. PAMC28650]
MSPAVDELIALGYSAAWSAARTVPGRPAYRIARSAADLAMSRQGPSVVQYARNLRRVLGERATPSTLHDTTAAGLRSYARYWLETFRLPSMDREEVLARAMSDTDGMEHIADAVAAGRGVVLALPHSGNWDVAGLMLAHQYGSLTSVAERLEPESLYRRFVQFRESLGMEILPLTGGATSTSSILKERLRAGGIVCLLGDRDLTASGVPVEFFGEQTRMPAGPAMLAALTGADLCVAHLGFTQQGHEYGWKTHVSPPVELPGTRLAERVRVGTQRVANLFQSTISERPQDWHMLQPLWLADLRAGHEALGEPADTGGRRTRSGP